MHGAFRAASTNGAFAEIDVYIKAERGSGKDRR